MSDERRAGAPLAAAAISFGLVHVPLYPATSDSGIDFDWLDKRSMDPMGYKRINKRTGKEVQREHIVRGVKVASEEYVVLSEGEIRAAYPRTTQTIEIEHFVVPTQLPFALLEKPYYLEPLARGEKVVAGTTAGTAGVERLEVQCIDRVADAPSAPWAASPAAMRAAASPAAVRRGGS